MNSGGTAPTRATEPSQRQIRAGSDAAFTGETVATNNLPLDNVSRIEEMITQLETRTTALVRHSNPHLYASPAPKNSYGQIAVVLAAGCFTIMSVGIFYISYNRSPQISQRGPAPVPLVIPPIHDSRDKKEVTSLDRLAKTLATSSVRLNRLEAALEKSNRNLAQLNAQTAPPISRQSRTDRVKVASAGDAEGKVPSFPQVASVAVTSPSPAISAVSRSITPLSVPPVNSGSSQRNAGQFLQMKPTDSAIAHKDVLGNIDYWIVARGDGNGSAKVLPIGVSAEGVVIRNLEDSKTYTLSHHGEWNEGVR
jgi:hypothetical protein